jgi:hypothetical protein
MRVAYNKTIDSAHFDRKVLVQQWKPMLPKVVQVNKYETPQKSNTVLDWLFINKYKYKAKR